ncbi:MAG: zinc-binding dehydrogenase [Acidobacteria bacterium]|nr:zinc-binding dehydrogenase [Acidobacteriota bacterium]
MTSHLMKAARVHKRGPSVFELDSIPVPEPGPGQLLIRVESAGVNFSDVKRRRGDAYPFPTEFPFIPGGEIAGTVEALGSGVDSPPVGTKVFALAGPTGFGGYAQYAVSYAATAMPMPEGLTFDAASTLLIAGSTARLILTETARLQSGESVLIPAATGGVGSFAIQLAAQAGAGKIIAAVSSDARRELALSLGAHEAINSSRANWPAEVLNCTGGRGVDVALEASGGTSLADTLSCLAPFGRLVVYGAASGVSSTLDATASEKVFYSPAPNQSILAFNIGGWFMDRPRVAGRALYELMQDVVAGKIQIPRITTLPLAEASLAHNLLEQRKSEGKLVLKPWA